MSTAEPIDTAPLRAIFAKEGRVWLRGALKPTEIDQLKRLSDGRDRPGARVSKDDPLFGAVSCAGFSQQIAQIWPNAKPVGLVRFNKTA